MILESTAREVRIVPHRRKDAPPDTLTAPAAEAAEASVSIAEDIGSRQGDPVRAIHRISKSPPDTYDSNLRK